MSVQAMVWVLEDAVCADGSDVPPHLVAPLFGLANHADENGRGSRCATETIAWYCRKKRDAAKGDLDKLLRLGLIRLGDQRMVLHLPADRRPTVYDLAMELKRKPRPGRKPSGRPRKPQVTAGPEKGGVQGPPGFARSGNGGVSSGNRGGLQTRTGGAHRPPEPSFEPVIEPPLPEQARRKPSAPSTSGQGGGGDFPKGQDPMTTLIDEIHTRRPGWAKAAIERVLREESANGRPFPLLAEAARQCAADMSTRAPGRIREGGPWWDHAANVVNGKAAPARPPWCGECESATRRLIYIDDDLDKPARCPRCGSPRPLTEAYA